MSKKRVLIGFAGIGDLVILVPLLRKLAEDAELDLVTRPYGPLLFAEQSFIGKVYGLAHPNRGKKGLGLALFGGHRRALGRLLAQQGYDEVFTFVQERDLINRWVHTWKGSAEHRVMDYPEKQADRIEVGLKSQGFAIHNVEPFPRLEVPEAAVAAATQRIETLGARVVGVQCGSGPVNKRWRKRPDVKGMSVAQWVAIVTHILESGDTDAVVFHGTAHERERVQPVIRALPASLRKRAHDWTGRTGLGELMALMKTYQAFVSVDTGPAHMAAAVGCPLLVFFGPSDPEAYLMQGSGVVQLVEGTASCQYCDGTPRFKTCKDNVCMQRITTQQMVDGWQRLQARVREEAVRVVDAGAAPGDEGAERRR